MARILLACQRSTLLRDLLRGQGHDAWTCDIEPCEGDAAYHIQEDAFIVARQRGKSGSYWEAMIAMPECRCLSSSG
jgi:hypothetical protein